jgi:EAL domain-containing protein (putative c-di-GMP-specific phosphodiesterase class I)
MPMREFEPIFDLKSGKVVGYEILYRGVENRENFFDVCTEKEDLEIFLEHVEEIRRIEENGTLYFVNIFGSTLLTYWDVVEKECGDLRGRLVLEISEKRRMDAKKVKDVIERLGFNVCLDDFGSGWSSIETAIRLKPNFVKVDIRQLGEVLPLVLKLSKVIQARPIIERVENIKDLLVANRHKAFLLQGKILEYIL